MPSLIAHLLPPLLLVHAGSSSPSVNNSASSTSGTMDAVVGGSWEYSVVDGFFIQSSPSFPSNDPTYDPLRDSFGLVDKSPSRWKRFRRAIERMNEENDECTSVKVLWVARHGQGYHNVAESKYGRPEWDRYWSKLNGDGEMTWGPDALLTPLGEQQAQAVNRAWREQREAGVPLPEKLYSSPLSRAAGTLKITWEGIFTDTEGIEGVKPVFKEGFREAMGVHTCDRRRTKSYLSSSYPTFNFEKGFAEEDELWSPTERETDEHLDARIRSELDSIFDNDPHSSYVSITAHGGVIGAVFRTVGHQKISVPPGGMVPIVVRAMRNASAKETNGAFQVQQPFSS